MNVVRRLRAAFFIGAIPYKIVKILVIPNNSNEPAPIQKRISLKSHLMEVSKNILITRLLE